MSRFVPPKYMQPWSAQYSEVAATKSVSKTRRLSFVNMKRFSIAAPFFLIAFQGPGIIMGCAQYLVDWGGQQDLPSFHPQSPHPADSKDDHSGLIVCAGWFLFTCCAFFFWLRWLGRKFWSMKKRASDERLLFLALLLFAGYVGLMHAAVLFWGLGIVNMDAAEHDPRYNPQLLRDIMLPSSIIALLTLLFSRWSVIQLLIDVFKMNRMQWWIRKLRYPLALWFIISMILVLVACSPKPDFTNSDSSCTNRPAAHTATHTLGLLIDALLIFAPIYTIKQTSAGQSSGYAIKGIFLTRCGMLSCGIAQFYFVWTSAPAGHPDVLTDVVWLIISTQVVMAYSIVSACTPYMKHMFDGAGLGTFFASTDHGSRVGDDASATTLHAVYLYADFSEHVGSEPAYDAFGNLRKVNVDGDAMPVDVATGLERAEHRESIAMRRLTRRGRRTLDEEAQEASISQMRLFPRLDSRAVADRQEQHPCGRTAAQHRRFAAQQQRQFPPGIHNVRYSNNQFHFGDDMNFDCRSALNSTFSGRGQRSRTTIQAQPPGWFDFSNDPVPVAWQHFDALVDEDLPIVSQANIHGMCSIPDCPEGSEWPVLPSFPEVGRLTIWVEKEVKVEREGKLDLYDADPQLRMRDSISSLGTAKKRHSVW